MELFIIIQVKTTKKPLSRSFHNSKLVMENKMAVTSGQLSPTYVWDPVGESTDTELDQSAVDTEANCQRCMEIAPCLKEKDEIKGQQSLFGPFSHKMKLDPESNRLESEHSPSNQEATTILIKDRMNCIIELAARRKEEDQKKREKEEKMMKLTKLPRNIDYERVLSNIDYERVLQAPALSPVDIVKTRQLLRNRQVAPGSLTKHRSEKFSENRPKMHNWHSGLNRFVKWHFGEINTKANISSLDMLKIVTKLHKFRVKDALTRMRNEQKNAVKRMRFTQVSKRLGSKEYMKITTELSTEYIKNILINYDWDGYKDISSDEDD